MVGKVTTRGQGVIMPGRKTVTTTYAKGGKVGKKKQGYKARKDESIAMRVRKKRTKKHKCLTKRSIVKILFYEFVPSILKGEHFLNPLNFSIPLAYSTAPFYF